MEKDLLNNIQNLKFRKDINFLRASSVVSVIIYHIEKSFLPGGWLGVDIFFFISGYLISNKIICDSFVNTECVGAINNQIFYSDDDHLSLEGSRLLAKEIFKIINFD